MRRRHCWTSYIAVHVHRQAARVECVGTFSAETRVLCLKADKLREQHIHDADLRQPTVPSIKLIRF